MKADARRRDKPAKPQQSDSRRYFTAGALIGVLIVLAYANSFSSGLVLDNKAMIELDPRVHTWSADTVGLIFSRNYWWPATSDLYRPLTTLSYWANYTLLGAGTNVATYHVVNLLLHWANATLVLLIVSRISGRFALGACAAAVFAVHPIGTEAVTNIIGRADLFATLSILLGGWCYLRAAEGGTARVRWLVGTGVSAFIGVFMKESAVMIGGFVVLYDALWRWPKIPGASVGERLRVAWRTIVLRGWVALVPAAIAVVVTRVVLMYNTPQVGQAFLLNPIAGAGRVSGFLTAWKVIGREIALLVFPSTLSSDYSYNQIPLYGSGASAWENAQCWLAMAGSVAALAYAFVVRKTHPLRTWAVFWFFVMLLPTSNLLFPIGSILGERFVYLPSIGFAVLAAAALLATGARNPRAALVVPGVVVAVLGTRTFVRNRDWHDQLSLWTSAVTASPNSFNAQKGYAAAFLEQNQNEAGLDSAIRVVDRALAIVSRTPLPITDESVTLLIDAGLYSRFKGQRLARRGQADSALQAHERSIARLLHAREVDRAINEQSRAASVRKGHRPEDIADIGNHLVYIELANSYLERANWSAAQAAGREAVHLDPTATQAYAVEGVSMFYARHPDSAAVSIAAGLLLHPEFPGFWGNLRSCFEAMRLRAPIVEDRGTFRLDPSSPLTAQLVSRAIPLIVQRFSEAKRIGEGEAIRARLQREYGVR